MIGYAGYKLLYFFRYLLYITDRISGKIEDYAYLTFFILKKEEIKDKAADKASKTERDLHEGIELSFEKENIRDMKEYNEAGFFINAEPQVLFTASDGLFNYS